jgi:hypothetical protein
MTVPRSAAGRALDAARRRAYHHAPSADPTTLARIPYVRLLIDASVASRHQQSKRSASGWDSEMEDGKWKMAKRVDSAAIGRRIRTTG